MTSVSVDINFCSPACIRPLWPIQILPQLLLCVRRQPEKAVPLLLEAEASIKVTHGDSHPVYASVRDLLDQARYTP